MFHIQLDTKYVLSKMPFLASESTEPESQAYAIVYTKNTQKNTI